MPSLVNRLVVRELARELEGAKGMIFLSFGGLNVKESEALRGKLAAKGVKLRMVRNALARRVLTDRGFAVEEGVLTGNTALAWGSAEAAIHAAKIATDPESKKTGKVKIRAGVLDGQLLSDRDAAALANVPDRNTLNARILGCISGPARGLVATLVGLPSGLTRVVDARAATLPKPAEPAPAPPATPEASA
jgi:large subunit ribosomal protein L10